MSRKDSSVEGVMTSFLGANQLKGTIITENRAKGGWLEEKHVRALRS